MDSKRSTDRLWIWFAVSSLVTLTVLAVSPVKDYFREYRPYQVEYRQQLTAVAGSAKELVEARSVSVGIRQIWISELGNRVDRCTSCHLGVENSAMAESATPFRTHPRVPHTDEFERFGCVSCHRGQGRATSLEAAHGLAEDWASPILPLQYVEASCGVCHEGQKVAEASALSQGRALIADAGCAACHEMTGFDQGPTLAPRLDGLAEKTSQAWLRRWLTSPRELAENTLMPDFQLPPAEVDALVAYLWSQDPLTEARIEPTDDGDYDRGKKIFRESRCISCHTVDYRGNGSAPELGTIGSKVSAVWLINFLADPHAYQPETDMPRYDFEHQDLLDLVAYLTEEFIEMTDDEDEEGDEQLRTSIKLVEEGNDLYQKYGCGGCHRLGNHGGMKIGPSLVGIGAKDAELLDFGKRDDLPHSLPDWLRAKITDPRSFRDELKMPEFALEPSEQEAIVTALLSLTGEDMPNGYRVQESDQDYDPPGRFGKLVDRYRCMSCHEIDGAGGDISKAPLTAEGSKVTKEWVKRYMLLPTTIRPLLTDRMIPLRMSEDDAAFIADFVANVYVDDDIPADIFPEGLPPDRVERGRDLFTERFACSACHQIAGSGGYYGPPLDDSPGKLHSGWIAWWLEDPQRWRSDVRCPNFGMDPSEAKDLSAYLMSLNADALQAPKEGQ